MHITFLSHIQVYVRSSDVDRCLVSAYSNLAGAYSQTGNVTLDFDLPHETWRPFPVHSVSAEMDEVCMRQSLPVGLCYFRGY